MMLETLLVIIMTTATIIILGALLAILPEIKQIRQRMLEIENNQNVMSSQMTTIFEMNNSTVSIFKKIIAQKNNSYDSPFENNKDEDGWDPRWGDKPNT